MSWVASCSEFSLPILEIRGLTGVCFVGGREKKSHPHEGGSKLQCNQEPLCPPPHLCAFHSLCLEGSSSTESSKLLSSIKNLCLPQAQSPVYLPLGSVLMVATGHTVADEKDVIQICMEYNHLAKFLSFIFFIKWWNLSACKGCAPRIYSQAWNSASPRAWPKL